jgi:sugar/nucleoside kinase (ribokinase family)
MAAVRSGIAIAGSVIVDKINEIGAYPQSGELTQITAIQRSVGGCVPNVALDLKKIRSDLTIRAIGKVGQDEEGAYVKDILAGGNVDVSGIAVSQTMKTSFTDVMSVTGGQRTFFAYAGACADFGAEDIDFDALDSKMLHLGYFLLLDKIDRGDGLKILQKASKLGIKTSIDLVSENSNRYALVAPCLPYTDYLIINEIEAGKLTGMEPLDENLEAIARKLRQMGVREKVIIHKPDRSVCLSDAGFSCLGSYILPDGYIKGTTGAGDAFCAGALIGIYEGWEDQSIMEFASGCAVMALGSADATSGLTDEAAIRAHCRDLPRRSV